MDQDGSVSTEKSVLEGTLPLIEKIKRARLELLDLSTRNRLLSTPRSGKARTIEVVNEIATAMYQTLVIDEKRFTFSPGRTERSPAEGDTHDETADEIHTDELLTQPEIELDEHGRVAGHWDSNLATRMTSAGLQKRLLDLYIDAKTLQEEQGVNILYLAIGYLKWRDLNTPQIDRYAPLVLVPVLLERSNAGEKFHLRWSSDDIQANLSLQAFLARSHGLRLPEIGDFEALDISAYMSAIEAIIGAKEHWAVLPNDAVLGLFSFAKFMMYRDLDPDQWKDVGGFEAIPTIRGVISDGFPRPDLFDDEGSIDQLIPPEDMLHVLDCDSSQSVVVHDARRGAHLLVQGPPGTGKSQTISNIIAAAVADGKKVLFVAEKMAALEVVKRRLDNVGIGVACLELHSNKANKRTLLEELKRTWQLGSPRYEDGTHIIEQLTEARNELNEHASRLHAAHTPSQLTPYQVLGHLIRLKRMGQSTMQLALSGPTTWAPHQKDDRFTLVQDLSERVLRMGAPGNHAWFGVSNDSLLPNDRDRLIDSIRTLSEDLEKWVKFVSALSRPLDLKFPICLPDVMEAHFRARVLVEAPRIGSDAFLSPVWSDTAQARTLVEAVESAQTLRQQLVRLASPSALLVDWSPYEIALAELPSSFTQDRELASIASIHGLLERSRADLLRLSQIFRETGALTLDSVQRLVAMAHQASTIPDLEREALVSHIWDRGIESIVELIDSVETIQNARKTLAPVFREPAWSTELEDARGHLAVMGSSWLRYLNGKWRRANRLVKTLCVSPKRQTRDEILQALDQLISAQGAQKHIAMRDVRGREALGASWERDRSNVAFLRSVVAWMRELRPLGAGARERLADLADRELATEIGKRLQPTLNEIREVLSPIHESIVAAQKTPWGEETLVGRIPMNLLQDKAVFWKTAADQCQTLNGPHNRTIDTLLGGMATILQTQNAVKSLDRLESTARSAFGLLWHGIESDPRDLKQAIAWIGANPTLLGLASRTGNAPALLKGAEQAGAYANRLLARLGDLFSRLKFHGNRVTAKEPERATIEGLAKQLERWQTTPEGLPEWVAYLARTNEARQKGLEALVNALASGELLPEFATATFDLAYYEAILAELVSAWPELAKFDGVKHSQRVQKFSDLDHHRINHAVRQVLKVHYEQLPQSGGAAGPTGVLRAEMARQRRHMPIRQLMQRCAPAVQALKPVFMMSPLSIAQFLPPGVIKFDLLVIDEASQVQPVDALGAIARAKQLVVVGDERQLPPTRFFARLLGDDRDDDDQGASAADIESILGLCRARGLPERMLRWHYRSRHQSLIAVSNSQFYENKLFIVPSPYNSEAGMGLRLHHMPENVYGRGETSVNADEAKAVAAAVIDHARRSPGMSLGVATFSTQQRRAIMDELELLRRQNPETEIFFSGRPDEPFFVKSLENVQGDERDVIYISVGYGRDVQGQLTMNFGPLSKEGGERRLNVLISRAKRRCEIFSSISDEDIDLERAKGKGIAAFKLFLHYARTGRLSIVSRADQDTKTVFEQQVAETLKERGYNVHSSIGTAGCFVDLAIADAERPGRYILGIECDGASYRSARSARDRDRLRKSVLEDQGWIIHRIWSSDWFHRPQAELERLVAAIERAKVEIDAQTDRAAAPTRAVLVDFDSIERGEVIEVSLVATDAHPSTDSYEEAKFTTPHTRYELHEVPSGLMASIVQKIIQVEGPVHRAEVVVRVRSIWGLQRAGGRIQAVVDAGIAHAISQRQVEAAEGDFLSIPGQEIRVRDRSEVTSLTLRRPDYLPPREIDTALRLTIEENLGASLEELVVCVSRKFGYRSTSAQLREVIEGRVHRLIEAGSFQWRGEHIAIANG